VRCEPKPQKTFDDINKTWCIIGCKSVAKLRRRLCVVLNVKNGHFFLKYLANSKLCLSENSVLVAKTSQLPLQLRQAVLPVKCDLNPKKRWSVIDRQYVVKDTEKNTVVCRTWNDTFCLN